MRLYACNVKNFNSTVERCHTWVEDNLVFFLVHSLHNPVIGLKSATFPPKIFHSISGLSPWSLCVHTYRPSTFEILSQAHIAFSLTIRSCDHSLIHHPIRITLPWKWAVSLLTLLAVTTCLGWWCMIQTLLHYL